MRPYICCHNHIGRTINRAPTVGQNAQMCLSRFAETDIYAAISMPTAVGSPITRGIQDIREQNEAIARACKKFPYVFPIGMALIEPRFGELGIDEAEKAMDDLGLVGIAGHPPNERRNPPHGRSRSRAKRTVQPALARQLDGPHRPNISKRTIYRTRQHLGCGKPVTTRQHLVRSRTISRWTGTPPGTSNGSPTKLDASDSSLARTCRITTTAFSSA